MDQPDKTLESKPPAVRLMRNLGLEPDPWQVQVAQSQADRMLLCCARQSGKTQVSASVALAAAMAEPGSLILVLSASLRQSQESFRDVLDLYKPWVGQVPPYAESALRLELTNNSRIVSLPGQESSIRGYSKVRLLLVDEAARVPDALYYSVRPMLAVSAGRIMALSTQWGKRGWFFKEWTSGGDWQRVMVTAYDCPRISPQFLEEERRTLPNLWFQ